MKYTLLISALFATTEARFHLNAQQGSAHAFDDRYKRESSHEAFLRNLSNTMPRFSNVWNDYRSKYPGDPTENKHEAVLRNDASVKQNYRYSTEPRVYKALKERPIETKHEGVMKDEASVK